MAAAKSAKEADKPGPEVSTSYGRLRGMDRDGSLLFRGIPFAEKPERFRRPTECKPWEGVKDCTRFGKMAPQPIPKARSLETAKFVLLRLTGILPMAPPEFEVNTKTMSEDCLFLNVTTPSLEGKRPVLVWIHGGAFIFGSGSDFLYRSSMLSQQQDVVLVTINYRLGALGFLKVEGGDANCGSWDQLQALKWVHQEIAAFGGDPDNITIFGQSAGGMSTGILLSSPLSQPYFKRAILMSGALSNAGSREDSEEVTKKFAEVVQCEPTAEALRKKSVQELVPPQMKLNSPLPFQPCVDGELIPDMPLRTVNKGLVDLTGKEVMIGCTSQEFNLFKPVMLSMRQTPLKDLVSLTARHLGPQRMDISVVEGEDGQAQMREQLREMFKKLRQVKGMASWSEVEKEFSNFIVFLVPSRLAARALAKAGCPVYLYSVDFRAGRLGAAHAMELPLLFGNHNKNRLLRELSGAQRDLRSADQISQWLSASFCRFARTGAPTPPQGEAVTDSREQHLSSVPFWPQHRLDSPYCFIYDRECRVEKEHDSSVLSKSVAMMENAKRPYGILPIRTPLLVPDAKL